MKIKIIGLGWLGIPLAELLQKEGHDVSGTTRTEEKVKLLGQKGLKATVLSHPQKPDLQDLDVVVLNVPPFEEELDWFRSWNWDPKTWILFISSTSVYPAPESRSGKLLLEQEDWARTSFKDWTILRLGGLIGGERHPGKHLSGRQNLPNRLGPVNLIHLDDAVGAITAALEKKVKGEIIHVVADEHPTREEYYSNYCREKELPLPHFNPEDSSSGKIVPNDELKHFYKLKRGIVY